MSVFDETPAARRSRRLPLAIVALVLLVAGVAMWRFRDTTAEAPRPATTTTAPARPAAPAVSSRPAPAPSAEPVAAAPAAPRPTKAPAREETPASVPAATASAVTLLVESDVPGASVFVDREFVGTAPVTLKYAATGSKQVNLSAEGFDGISRRIDLEAGDNAVTMRFKEVRLNASTGVAHKHGMGGGCEGTLRATVDGLTYDTSNKGDAFTLRYDQVESFEVNYLEKNLRVKQRGGKTWNFTDRQADNADRLFVFHRDVQAARDKLAKGYAAAR